MILFELYEVEKFVKKKLNYVFIGLHLKITFFTAT